MSVGEKKTIWRPSRTNHLVKIPTVMIMMRMIVNMMIIVVIVNTMISMITVITIGVTIISIWPYGVALD